MDRQASIDGLVFTVVLAIWENWVISFLSLDHGDEVRARLELPEPEGVLYLNRTHSLRRGAGRIHHGHGPRHSGPGGGPAVWFDPHEHGRAPHHAAAGPVRLPHPDAKGQWLGDGSTGRGLQGPGIRHLDKFCEAVESSTILTYDQRETLDAILKALDEHPL